MTIKSDKWIRRMAQEHGMIGQPSATAAFALGRRPR